jgi:hypothetical protein
MDGKREHRMSIFNELAVSLYLYLLMCLTDFHGWDNLREHFGFALFILVAFTLLINLLVAFYSDILLLLRFLRRKFCPQKEPIIMKESFSTRKKGIDLSTDTSSSAVYTDLVIKKKNLNPNKKPLVENS